MVVLIYKPSNPYPHNEVVDVADIDKPFSFECFVDAGVVHDYDLYGKRNIDSAEYLRLYSGDGKPVYGNNGDNSVIWINYEDTNKGLDETLEDDDVGKVKWSNENDYQWKLRMFDNSPSVLLGFGTILEYQVPNERFQLSQITSASQSLQQDYNTFYKIIEETSGSYTFINSMAYVKIYTHPLVCCNALINTTSSSYDYQYYYKSNKDDDGFYSLYFGANRNNNITDVENYPKAKMKYYIKVANHYFPIYKIVRSSDDNYLYLYFPLNLEVDGVVYSARNTTTTSGLGYILAAGTQYELYCNYIDSNEFSFKAKATPTISLSTTETISEGDGTQENPKKLVSSSATFVCDTSTMDVVKYRFLTEQLYDGGWGIIDDSENIYSSYVTYNFDRFLHGKKYRVRAILTDRDGLVVETEYYISPEYSNTMIDFVPKVFADTYKGSVMVDFNELLSIPFKEVSGAQLGFDENNYLVMNSGGGYFDEITDRDTFTIPEEFSFVVQFKILHNYTGLLYSVEDVKGNDINIVWDGSHIIVTKNNVSTQTIEELWRWSPYSTVDGTTEGSPLTSTTFPVDRTDEADSTTYQYVWDDNSVWFDDGVWVDNVPLENIMYTLVYDNGAISISEMVEEVAAS